MSYAICREKALKNKMYKTIAALLLKHDLYKSLKLGDFYPVGQEAAERA